MCDTSSRKISILTPFKNAQLYLLECMQSILNQTYQNWEVIAVNDHSQDNGVGIIKEFALADARIHLYENEGCGIIDGLKTAYKYASGQLITRMDADDIMAKEKLSELRSTLVKHGRGHVGTGLVKYFSDTSLGAGYKKYEQWLNGIHRRGDSFKEVYKECVIPSPCWMIYREDLDRVGAFDSDVYPEDYDLCFRFYKADYKIVSSKKICHHWRDYPSRTSRTDPRLKDQSFMKVKLKYFLDLEVEKKKGLVVWGAGRKGKLLAKLLDQENIPYSWVCNNQKKIGKGMIRSFETLGKKQDAKILIAVSQRGAKEEIHRFLTDLRYCENKDFYFFA